MMLPNAIMRGFYQLQNIMQSLITLKLYTTTNCHLCEQAMALLASTSNANIILVEIADDDALIAIYGTRIPVLQRSDNLAELNWPFNSINIQSFIQ